MTLIEMRRTQTPNGRRYFANGVRVSRDRYDFLDILGRHRQDTFLTTIRRGIIRHFKTIYVP
jgi:hypothetical protein